MYNNQGNSFSKTLLALSIAGASSISHASSFALIEQSASGQGSAYAGAAAIAEDASTIYFNPAGMTRLSGQQIVVAGHIISPDAKYTDSGNSTAANGLAPLTGPNSSTGDPAFVPNFYYSAELPNEVYVGVGVNVPFGLSTEYDNGWIGRYHALRSEISTINVNPSIAWKVTEKVSVGFGFSIQYMDLELTNSIDSVATCGGLASNPMLGPIVGADCAAYAGVPPSNAATDSGVKLDGDSTEIGWNAGILIDLDDKNRLGIAYRSAIKHNVSGNASYTLDTPLANASDSIKTATGFNVLQNTPLEATAELPQTFSVSYAGEVAPKWTALFDWTWTGWDSLDVITIRQAGGVPGQEATLDLAYKNTNRYALGVNYQHTEKLIYRGGLALDQTPIRSPETTSARIPGNDRKWLSLGVGYAPSSSWSYDIGYSHLFINDTDINNGPSSSTSGATLTGTYESSVDILSAQANFFF